MYCKNTKKMNYVVKEKLRVDSVVYLHVYWL